MAKNFVSNKDESARLFKSGFLEFFSHVHFSVPLIVYIPVVAYFLRKGLVSVELTISGVAMLFLTGLLTWTLTEYLLHRFVFHYEPKTDLGKQLHFLMHGVHHDYPNDSLRLVMPPVISLPLAVGILCTLLSHLGTTTPPTILRRVYHRVHLLRHDSLCDPPCFDEGHPDGLMAKTAPHASSLPN